jgi:dihydropteroate synthase
LPHQWRNQSAVPDIVALVLEELGTRAAQAVEHGVSSSALVLDPGFGFGKNFDENYPLLARFSELHTLGFPLLAAVSRKSFLGRTVDHRLAQIEGARLTSAPSAAALPPAGRDTATLAAMVAAVLAGAHIVRVHAVRPTVEAMAVADAVLAAER